LLDSKLRNLGGVEFLRANLNKQDLLKIIKTIDTFTSEILHIWAETSFKASISSIDQLKAQSLWHNSLLRVGNKPIYCRSWSLKEVNKVGYLMNDPNSFLSFSILQNSTTLKQTFLRFKASYQLLRPHKKARKH